jgi:hypothetical protein
VGFYRSNVARARAARIPVRIATAFSAIAAFALSHPAHALTDVCYEGGSLLPNFKLNGNAVLNGTDLIVTQSAMGQTSSITYYPKFSAGSDFHIELQIEISKNVYGGADGMAFVMQNDPNGPSALGVPGEGIGYMGITNSVIVEFDTFRNDWDPNDNHIALTLNGNPDHTDPTNRGLPVISDLGDINLKSGQPLFLWIDYAVATTRLSVFLSPKSTKPDEPAMVATLDLSKTIGPSFYAAFTGSTGGGWSQHEVVQLFASDHAVDPKSGCCQSNANCSTSPAGPVCDSAKRLCGTCTLEDTSHCPPAMPACDLSSSSNQCAVNCDGNYGSGSSHACVSPAFPACTPGGSCATCNGDFMSNGTVDCGSGAPFCAPAGYCGVCTKNADCMLKNAVHASGYCNAPKGACVATCAADADCGPGNVCDKNDSQCGYADGDGPCTQANAVSVCRSLTCGSHSAKCVPAGGNGCAADADCPSGQFCDGSKFMCTALLPNGADIPADAVHNGMCTPAVGTAVCASGVCDTDNRCGLANGHTVCKTGDQCRSSTCDMASGACIGCNGDFGSHATEACMSMIEPVCSDMSECVRCKTNADCATGTHTGPICQPSGACGNGCTVDADCGQTHCNNPSGQPGQGVCASKASSQGVSSSGGCGCYAAGGSSPVGAAVGVGLGLAVAAAGIRRRRFR